MGQRRARQHVNPLGIHFLQPRATAIHPPAHLGPNCRVEVELGCADAKFTFEAARRHPEWFVVGLDIREPWVRANRQRQHVEGLLNVAFGYVNINVDLDRVFPFGSVDRFHLLFPDPWFKKRHQKRRVVSPDFCATLHGLLRPQGEIHVASDRYELALDAMATLETFAGFVNLNAPWSFWRSTPFDSTSRREDTTVARGQRVWRLRYGRSIDGLEPSANARDS